MKTILSWITGSHGWIAYILLAVAGFTVGWKASSVLHERDFEIKRADFYASLQTQEKTFREKENELQKQVAEALSQRDAALADVGRHRAESDRLRIEADALADKLSRTSGTSCDRYRKPLSECVRLLGEGAELAGEGAGIAQRDAADIEVMRKALKTQ